MKKLTKKQLDKAIEQFYYKNCQGTQINIMDIPKLFRECERAYAEGADLEQAVKSCIERYNVKT